jgi:DNA-3-methyladenine glycosylase I
VKTTRRRCAWAQSDPLLQAYHDREWGRPTHDDRRLFEFLVLEGAQAGLSWITILRKRENYRRAFANFDPKKVSRFGASHVRTLLRNDGIVRNRAKIQAAISNANELLRIASEFGSFDRYVWQFVGGKPQLNKFQKLSDLPAATAQSEALSSDLRKRGFSFVGPGICYSFMQACGLVNDHVAGCFLYGRVLKAPRS